MSTKSFPLPLPTIRLPASPKLQGALPGGALHGVSERLQHVLGFSLPGGAAPTPGPNFSNHLLDRLAPLADLARGFGPKPGSKPAPGAPDPARAEPGQFLRANFAGTEGNRPYRLYVPTHHDRHAPLLVLLHGCSQTPEDFATGTAMNALAEQAGCFVAYPGQLASANSSRCWNWFEPGDQRRDRGEPAILAGLTREIMAEYAIDPARVFVAGLSAGGAKAAILGATYPDLFAAIGVHSGLACGAARDVPSAFRAMQAGAAGTARAASGARPRAIVFHGDQDTTVSPRNADAVIEQAIGGAPAPSRVLRGQVPGGRAYTRRFYEQGGKTRLESWQVHGGGHAWFGGSPRGSYTDPTGPNASAEMLRFFLEG